MQKLNPYSKTARELEQKAQVARIAARKKAIAQKQSKAGKADKKKRNLRFKMLADGLEQSFKDAQKIVDDEIKAGEYRGDDSEDEEESDE